MADRTEYYKEHHRQNKLRKKAKRIFGYVEPKPKRKTRQEVIIEEKLSMKIRMERITKFISQRVA